MHDQRLRKEALHKSLHHLQPHTATCNTVNYMFSRFTDKQLENTCFSFCQWLAEKQEINQAEIINLEQKHHEIFWILHKIHYFLKWQERRQIDLKIIVFTDSRVTMDCSEKENRFGSFFLYIMSYHRCLSEASWSIYKFTDWWNTCQGRKDGRTAKEASVPN